MATNDELRPYGFAAGDVERWCAGCNRNFKGGPRAFKCRGCAVKAHGTVELECKDAGYGDDE